MKKLILGVWITISSLSLFFFSFALSWGILGDDYIKEGELGVSQFIWNILPKEGMLTYFGFAISILFVIGVILLFLKNKLGRKISLIATGAYSLFLLIVLIEEIIVDFFHYRDLSRFPAMLYSIAIIITLINFIVFYKIKERI